MQFFKSVRRAPGRATPSKDGVALRHFDDHRFKLLVRRHALSSHEHIGLSSKFLSSCYTCAPITDHQFSGGVAERLIAPVLKTGRPKGLVSSNLTPSAPLVERNRRGDCITVHITSLPISMPFSVV